MQNHDEFEYCVSSLMIASSPFRERVFTEIYVTQANGVSAHAGDACDEVEKEFATVYWHDTQRKFRIRIEGPPQETTYWDFDAHELLATLMKSIFQLHVNSV